MSTPPPSDAIPAPSTFGGRVAVVAMLTTGAVAAGAGAVFFAWMEDAGSHFQGYLLGHSSFWPLLVCPLFLYLIIALRERHFKGTDGTGIPQTIAALESGEAVRESLLSLRVGVGKMLLTTLGLFGFFSIGREGPSVQLGAILMRACGNWVQLPRHFAERGVILAGGAAGIAAAFNAPLAGIVFTFEEIGRSFDKRNLGLIVRTAIIACIIGIIAFGNYYFYGDLDSGRAPLTYSSLKPWLVVPLIGLLGGLLGGLFAKALIWAMPRVGKVLRTHTLPAAAVIGLAIAGIGLTASGATFGGGYQQARALLLEGSPACLEALPVEQRDALQAARDNIGPAYAAQRAAASFLILMTGIPGGLFDPSFSVGAGLGAVAAPWLSWSGACAQSIMLLFMVAYFTGVVQSPLTSVIILIEMTGVVAFALPMGLAAVLAYEVSRRICPESLYECLARNFMRS